MAAGNVKPLNAEKLAELADSVAETIEAFAYGPECFTSDQSAVLTQAKGWRLFAERVRGSE